MQHARRFLYQSGGVRLTPQTRSQRHLSGSEREEISRGTAAGESARQLAKRLGRSPWLRRRSPRRRPAATAPTPPQCIRSSRPTPTHRGEPWRTPSISSSPRPGARARTSPS
ncbi:helix-turn-helix domain-containing protein [Streptomyces sparsogenes]|uniref:helix-turn-helix domain-containing protein n=1 Tax=Streptomyces sparsogenes TaxID=67365 RepID=UPI0033D9A9C0